ncbi:MAG: MerR family transcriptional regulator [Actinobacteria bacterium]|nr:MerR family transcriptional regulator [Actinomycetota bacterium]MBU1943971.1 MerR family transcriptional regulator [Actinomycetota bacterium]MBU2686941.1 MerR family transcriptional regulator [Actinomycetota bacterium]
MKDRSRWPYRISDLEKLTGLNRNTIHYYVREGLVSPPYRTGKTMAYYDDEHIAELNEIRLLRNRGMSLSYIRSEMQKKSGGAEAPRVESDVSAERRRRIMDKGVELFTRRGYYQTKVEDIAREVGVGNSTFYRYFPNKRALFIECLNDVYQTMFEGVWGELREKTDPMVRLKERARIVLNSYSQFVDILQVLHNAVEDDPGLEAKRKEIYAIIAATLKRDILNGIEQGVFPEVNADVWSYMLLGLLESASLLLTLDSRYEPDEVVDAMFDVISIDLWEKVIEKNHQRVASRG